MRAFLTMSSALKCWSTQKWIKLFFFRSARLFVTKIERPDPRDTHVDSEKWFDTMSSQQLYALYNVLTPHYGMQRRLSFPLTSVSRLLFITPGWSCCIHNETCVSAFALLLPSLYLSAGNTRLNRSPWNVRVIASFRKKKLGDQWRCSNRHYFLKGKKK